MVCVSILGARDDIQQALAKEDKDHKDWMEKLDWKLGEWMVGKWLGSGWSA